MKSNRIFFIFFFTFLIALNVWGLVLKLRDGDGGVGRFAGRHVQLAVIALCKWERRIQRVSEDETVSWLECVVRR
jgi:hypothetical protein